MGGRIIAGVIGFVVLVLLIQNYVLGDGDSGDPTAGRTGVAPTATLPAQTPVAISLGEVQQGSTPTNGAPGSSGGNTTYVVQSGDTLGSIAASFNVSPEGQAAWITEVLDLNGIADARGLQAGQELLLPEMPASPTQTAGSTGSTGSTGSNPIVTATPGVGSTGSTGSSGGSYVIVSGDTPYGIAEKFCVENPAAWVNELIDLNDIDASNMKLGQELVLPDDTPAQCQ